MYVLVLNNMRGSYEEQTPIAQSDSKEALIAFVERERSPNVIENKGDINHTYYHTFKVGPLFWYNFHIGREFIFELGGAGGVEAYSEKAKRDATDYYNNLKSSLIAIN